MWEIYTTYVWNQKCQKCKKIMEKKQKQKKLQKFYFLTEVPKIYFAHFHKLNFS